MHKVDFPKELTEDTEKHVMFFLEKMMESIYKNIPDTFGDNIEVLGYRTIAMERAIGSLIMSFIASLTKGDAKKVQECLEPFTKNLMNQCELNCKEGLVFTEFKGKKT